MGKTYGYILPSGEEQSSKRSKALREFGVPENCIYLDGQRENGPGDRPAYRQLMEQLTPGDTVVIGSIDQLGHNYASILEEWRRITEEKGAAIVILDMPHLDTRTSQGLNGAQLGDLILRLMTQMAKVEYDFFRRRQAEGVAAAKARGVKFGRRPMERPDSYEVFYDAWKRGTISARSAAKFLGIDHHTFLNWAKVK